MINTNGGAALATAKSLTLGLALVLPLAELKTFFRPVVSETKIEEQG